MSNLEIILGTFSDDIEKAGSYLKSYSATRDVLGIVEAVAIVNETDKKPEVTYMGTSTKKAAAGVGILSGAFVGLLAGPAGFVVGGVLGALAGGAGAALSHAGISKDMITTVEESLPEHGSAILVLVELEKANPIINDLKSGNAEIVHETVHSDQVEQAALYSPSGGISEV